MVVAGRALPDGDVAIMMVEAEATEHTVALVAGGAAAPTEDVVAAGLEAAKPAIRELCRAQAELAEVAAKPVQEFPVFLEYAGRRLRGRRRGRPRRGRRGAEDRAEGRARRGARPDQGAGRRAARRPVRGPREGGRRRAAVADQERGARPGPPRAGPHRRPRPARHPSAHRGDQRAAAGARLGAVRARRDPDHGRHHAEHAAHGADARHARPGEVQAVHAQLQLPALLGRRDRPGRRAEAARDRPRRARRAGADPGAAGARGVPVRDPAGVGGARAPTGPPRWARCARPRWRCCRPACR